MPEYDAFGREIGEDTLGGLGGRSSPQATPQPVPVPADGWTEQAPPPAAAPPAADAPAAPPPQATFTVPTAIPRVRRRRMGGFGCLIGLVILAAIVAGPVIAIVTFVGAADDAIDEVTGIIDDATPPTIDTPSILEEDATAPPVGIGGRSMVRPGNFKVALARVDDAGFGRATFIRLSPDRAAFQLVKGARQRGATVDHLGAFARGAPTRGPRGAAAITLSAIDPAAPARLVRASAKRFGVREKGIDYLVGSPATDGGHGWVAYFKNGTYVQGDAKGRVVRRIS